MKRWLLAIVLLAAAIPAFAGWQSRDSNYNINIAAVGSVSYDAVASNSLNGVTATNISWTHTPVGTPTGAAVGIEVYTGGTCASITSVTYGGNAMTLATSVAITGQSTLVAMYGLANPPAGAQTVVVTFNTSCSIFAQAGSVTVTGGSTSSVFRASNSAQGSSTTPGVSVTSATGDLVVDVVGNTGGTTTQTQGGSQAKRWGTLNAGTSSASGSTLAGGSGSTAMSWTLGVTHPWGHVAASFQP